MTDAPMMTSVSRLQALVTTRTDRRYGEGRSDQSTVNNRQLVAGSLGSSLLVGVFILLTNGPSTPLFMGLLFVAGVTAIVLGLNVAGLGVTAFGVLDPTNRVGNRGQTRFRASLGLLGIALCLCALAVADSASGFGGEVLLVAGVPLGVICTVLVVTLVRNG
jgi:hypothetical protein